MYTELYTAVTFLFILLFNQKARVCRQNKNTKYLSHIHCFQVCIIWYIHMYPKTVRPLDTSTWDRKKCSPKLSYIIFHERNCHIFFMKMKTVYLQGFCPKTVYLKCFGIQLKTVYLQGPCSWRPCISRPCCTYGLQQFAKIRAVKVDYFDFPGEIFEKFELDARLIACNF